MGTIRVEAVPVQSYNLGLFRFDHLQLVYQDETDFIDSQDYWFVIEGIQDGSLFSATLGASGESGRLSLGVANGGSRDGLIAKIGTPETRGSRIISSGPNILSLWDKMASYAGEVDAQKFPYIGLSWPFGPTPTINSTSLIASVLWSVGIDLNNLMPFNIRLSPGPETILGTGRADVMTAGGNFTTVATGSGNDTLLGSANAIWWEKFYGGSGNDTITWSFGNNIMHGGQPSMTYAGDGRDTIDYSGVGAVHIEANDYAINHKVAEYNATFEGGSDQWFSIERITWDAKSDVITAGAGVGVLEEAIELDLKGSGGGRGDQLGMSDGNTALLVNVVSDSLISVQSAANEGLDAGYWVNSAEWFVGSTAGDRIYAGSTLLGVDGDDGDDTLDARLVAAFTGQSPLGYDIELYGGAGDDTIVSGEGRTYAEGGDGADRFVLSAMTSGNGTVEFVIVDADASDKLYIPYDMFKLTRGGYDGSQLFQVTGGIFKIDEAINPAYFEWGAPDDDQVQGNIEFAGQISYEMDGSDLVIKILQGHAEQFTVDYGPGEPPGPSYTLAVGELNTETIVRVTNWSEGVLGLTFPLTWDVEVFAGTENGLEDYPGYQTALDTATAPDKFIDALEDRPESHVPKDLGTGGGISAVASDLPVTSGSDGDDTIAVVIDGPYSINGMAGNDIITASDGGDLIDGGTGNDAMDGGRGNDAYFVDSTGDTVIERDRGGFDHVYASVDYQLGAFVEHVTLEGLALRASGNELRNRIAGNALDNTLSGGGGNDVLAGNGGDDQLTGGIGSDAYVYEIGDGHDTIIESAADGAAEDLIIFAGDLAASDITFIRNPDHLADLVLRLTDGGSLTVQDYFAPAGHTIEGIEFTSGGAWSADDVATRAAEAIVTRNTAPIAFDDVFAFAGGASVTIPFAALLDNDSDADGHALTITALSNITGGTAAFDGQGNIVITRTGAAGTNVSFDYTVSDGNGGTARANFDVAMDSNSAPIITSGTLATVVANTAAAGRLIATDADGDTLIYAVKAGAGPAKGIIAFLDDGNFTYTPDTNATGSDTFILTVSDGFSAPVERQFTVTLPSTNTAPTARADSGFTVRSGAALTLAPASLLANDSDADGHALAITGVTAITGGTVALTSGGITFTAQTGYVGPASFSYAVSDGHGGTSSALVNLTVENTAPIARADSGFLLHAGQALTLTSARLLANDSDSDGHALSISSITNAHGGTIRTTADGGVTFHADDSFSGAASFEYTISDGRGGTSTAFVAIHVLSGVTRVLDRAPNNIITGTSGRDVLTGTAIDEVFNGLQDHDTFVFLPNQGNDQINGFETGDDLRGAIDILDLRGNGLTGYLDLLSHIHTQGADTLITLDTGTSILLKGVAADTLMVDNFRIL